MNGYVEMGLRHARRVVVLVIGGTVVLLGLVGMMLPIMPGFIFIPLGLAILATEFVWAKRWLRQVKQKSRQVWDGVTGATHTPDAGRAAPHPVRSESHADSSPGRQNP